MTRADDRPMRADARRNRDKLLAAASRLFAEAGTDVSLDAIARDAGVGIGTLYRHFPTRDALVEAAYRAEVERLSGAAPALLADLPPDEALEAWMGRYIGYAAAKRGMSTALQSVVASNSGLFADARAQLVRAVGSLLEAGVAAGTIRPDADADDVLRALGAVWLVPQEPGWEETAGRLLRLLMDGLRYGARS